MEVSERFYIRFYIRFYGFGVSDLDFHQNAIENGSKSRLNLELNFLDVLLSISDPFCRKSGYASLRSIIYSQKYQYDNCVFKHIHIFHRNLKNIYCNQLPSFCLGSLGGSACVTVVFSAL